MTVAIRTSGTPTGPGVFEVPSETFPGECHTVVWRTEGLCWCDCMGFAQRHVCRHIQAVALAVEVEARQPPTPDSRAAAGAALDAIGEMFDCGD